MKAALAFLFSVILAAQAWASNLTFQKDKGQVTFLAVGKPSALKIRGEGTGAEGQLKVENKKASGELKFDMQSLKTGIAMRDRHMHEKYLKSNVNTTAVLKILNAPTDAKEFEFQGELTLNKVTKPVSGKIILKEQGNKTVKGFSEFEIKLSDYQIDIPSYAGITVAENVKVEVTFQADVN